MAIFAGGWEFGRNQAWRITGGAGLITVLTLIAAVILAIPGSHGQRIFDLVMGLNRWCYRVLCLRRADARRVRDVAGVLFPIRGLAVGGGAGGELAQPRAWVALSGSAHAAAGDCTPLPGGPGPGVVTLALAWRVWAKQARNRGLGDVRTGNCRWSAGGRLLRSPGTPSWEPCLPVDLPPFLATLLTRQARSPGLRCACAPEHGSSGRYVFPSPGGSHHRRSNYGRRVFRPACDGRYEPVNGRPPRIGTVDGTTWPGILLATWPAATPGNEARNSPEGYVRRTGAGSGSFRMAFRWPPGCRWFPA